MYRVLSAAALTGKRANETEGGIFTSRTGKRAGKYTGGQIKRIVKQLETCPVSVFVAPASNPYGNTHGDTTRTVLSSVEHLDIFYIQTDASTRENRGEDHQFVLLTTYLASRRYRAVIVRYLYRKGLFSVSGTKKGRERQDGPQQQYQQHQPAHVCTFT